jgi:hypothetical protein
LRPKASRSFFGGTQLCDIAAGKLHHGDVAMTRIKGINQNGCTRSLGLAECVGEDFLSHAVIFPS